MIIVSDSINQITYALNEVDVLRNFLKVTLKPLYTLLQFNQKNFIIKVKVGQKEKNNKKTQSCANLFFQSYINE